MEFKRFIPLLILAVLVAVVFVSGNVLRDDPTPYQTQVGEQATKLEEVHKFSLEIELKEGQEVVMDYLASGETPSASVRREGFANQEENRSNERALEEIQNMVNQLSPLSTGEPLTMIQTVLDQLQIAQNDVREFELEIRLTDGMQRKIEFEVDNADDENIANADDKGKDD